MLVAYGLRACGNGRTALQTSSERGALNYVAGRAAAAVYPEPNLLELARLAVVNQKQAIREGFRNLRLQISPLSDDQWVAPKPASATADIPSKPVAAVAVVVAAAKALAPNAPASATGQLFADLAAGAASLAAGRTAGAAGIPVGFEGDLAMRCAELSLSAYHSADAPGEEGALIAADLERLGGEMRVVAEVADEDTHTYALLVRDGARLYVSFRGSCSLRNVASDIAYADATAETEAYAREVGLPHAPPLQLHRGFVEAYRALRPRLLAAVRAEQRREPARSDGGAPASLGLVLTGHSMGGSLAMLAALDLAHQAPELRAQMSTITFAAPRVGNAAFAELFERTFPRAASHWAIQAAHDAVPHLPFAAWGFRHPEGVAVLPEEEGAGLCSGLRRTGDRGDSIQCLRPRAGDLKNWATCHDMAWYMERMRGALGEGALAAA